MGTEIQKAEPTAMQRLQSMLDNRKQLFAQILPKHLTPERMIKVGLLAVGKSQQLMKCSQNSIVTAVIQSAELGLELGSALGHAYLVPYKDTAQLVVGYRGMVELARRSGQISTIEAVVVHERDQFTFERGLEPKLKHVPSTEANVGKLTHVYAIARFRDGGYQFDVMTAGDVERIRARSKAGSSGPWQSDYEEMAKKTVLRRLFKLLPTSIEMAKAMAMDEAQSGERPVNQAQVFENVDFSVPEAIEGEVVPDHDPQTGEVRSSPAFLAAMAAIEKAADKAEVEACAALLKQIVSKDEHAQAKSKYDEKKKSLKE